MIKIRNGEHLMKKLFAFLLLLSTVLLCSCGFINNNTTSRLIPASDEFDYVLAGEDNCFLVVKSVDTIDGFHEEIGVMDAESNWIQHLSSTHPFLEDGKLPINWTTESKDRTKDEKNRCIYMNDGMFMYITGYNTFSHTSSGLIYNSKTNTSFEIEKYGEEKRKYIDGYWIVRDGSGSGPHEVLIIDEEGNINHTGLKPDYIGAYSEGVFFGGDGKFYDADMKVKIDLSEYNIINYATFQEGRCKIIIKKNNGSEFETEIDHDGNFLYEPQKYSKEKSK